MSAETVTDRANQPEGDPEMASDDDVERSRCTEAWESWKDGSDATWDDVWDAFSTDES
ncbi:MAG: hypothetical protein MUE69_33940 [Myxococcota bacterium]|nr:hypothetical protein [Myxococcota bacterium]